MQNILLTGAHSPTGRAGLAWLRETFPDAVLFAASRSRVVMRGVTPVVLDLSDPAPPTLPPLDAVLHLAAVTPTMTSDREAFERINVVGAHRLFRALTYSPGAVFFNFSSLSVYAASSRPEIGEDHPKTSTEPYGASKFAFEQVLAELADERALCAISARIPVLLAPGIGSNFMSKWRDALLAGRDIVLFNPEAPFNACVWWPDLLTLIDTFRRRAATGHVACNTATTCAMPVQLVARAFCEAFGATARICCAPGVKPGQLVNSDRAHGLGLPARTVLDAITLFAEGSRS